MLKKSNDLIIKEKILSMILGGIVGDVLGVPFEFKKGDSFKITEMVGNGTHNQPLGTYSDDTSLTMCLIENIIENGDENTLLEKFKLYLEEGYWAPFGKCFDIGITTRRAIQKYKKGIIANKCGSNSEYDNGNGALMRISPLVPIINKRNTNSIFKYNNYVKYKIDLVKSICEITHRHPRSTLACIIYIEFMNSLFDNIDKFIAYEKTKKIIKSYFNKKDFLGKDEFKKEFNHFHRILGNNIYTYNINEIYSTGYVIHSLEAAMWCFLKYDNYKDTVFNAINLGDDTDTIGFITGTMAGLYYGINSIPKDWINNIKDIEKIKNKCEQFYNYI